MPTLDDVARRAGVSRVTASRVLNGTYQNKVSASTRDRVKQAVAELNYHVNIPARALRSKRTMEFGLLIPDLAFSFMPEVVQGLQDVATDLDYGCLVYLSHNQAHQEERAFRTLVARRVDGVIWMPTSRPTENTIHLANNLPTVQLLSKTPDLNAPAVLINQEQGGYIATQHMLAWGHTRIAYMYVGHRHWQQRKLGFQRALAEKGLERNSQLLVSVPDNTWEDSLTVARTLLATEKPPTAILAASDTVAWGVVRAAHTGGLQVPNDFSVVGFGNMAFANQVEVPLTTVSHPKREVGQVAMQKLASLLSGAPVLDTTLPVELVERLSSGPPPVNS